LTRWTRQPTHSTRLYAVTALVGVAVVSWMGASAGWAGTSGAAPVIVSGTLVNGVRQPVTGVRVDLYRPTTKPLRVGWARTDTSGRFVVRAGEPASGSNSWLKLDLLTGNASLTVHRVVRRKFVGGRWVGPTKAGTTGIGVVILAPGQPSVAATTTHWGSTAEAEGWIYGLVLREPGSDPRSGSGSGATVPVAGDTVVARDAAGSASAVSARDGSFQIRLPARTIMVSEDICGVSKQVTVEPNAATRVTLEIPNSC
jgi:hypothetical protein